MRKPELGEIFLALVFVSVLFFSIYMGITTDNIVALIWIWAIAGIVIGVLVAFMGGGLCPLCESPTPLWKVARFQNPSGYVVKMCKGCVPYHKFMVKPMPSLDDFADLTRHFINETSDRSVVAPVKQVAREILSDIEEMRDMEPHITQTQEWKRNLEE